MKLKQNDVKMLLILIGVLAAVCSHMLVRTPLEEEMLILEGEVAAAQEEKQRLKEIEAVKDVLYLEIEENVLIVENELMKYPEDVLTETYIMYAENMRNSLGISLNSVDISVPSLINQTSIMRRIDQADVEIPIASYLTTLSFGWQFTYAQLKSFVEYVHSDAHRTVLNTVNVSFDASTGDLTGSAIIYKYFIATPSYVFEPTDIPMIATGNSDPFGTGQAVPEA